MSIENHTIHLCNIYEIIYVYNKNSMMRKVKYDDRES